MITRAAKLLLVAGMAIFYILVVFNNLTDFDSNYCVATGCGSAAMMAG
jgi:predicted small integral membrane protein